MHADDLGLSASENEASLFSIENGMVNSGSVMAPCPKFHSIIRYAKNHPGIDLGVHLTLTSEWPLYKWRPLLPHKEVQSLADVNGYFHENNKEVIKNFNAAELEMELRAQINSLKKEGVEITHLDTHMNTAFSDFRILEIYIKLGRELRLPVLLTNELPVRYLLTKNSIVVDRLYYAKPGENPYELGNYYRKILNSLKPGLNCILVHLAFNDPEMLGITGDQVNYGKEWRQSDFDFFTGQECRDLIKSNDIQLITWREIRDKLVL